MKTINTERALDCELGADVFSSAGSLILPAGVTLTQPLINALMKQQVLKVQVIEVDASSSTVTESVNPQDAAALEHFIESIEPLFAPHTGDNMKELKQCLIRQRPNNMPG